MRETRYDLIIHYMCRERGIKAFSHYYCYTNNYNIIYQGYEVGNYFIKVIDNITYIHTIDFCKFITKIPRPLIFNGTNMDKILETIKMSVLFS